VAGQSSTAAATAPGKKQQHRLARRRSRRRGLHIKAYRSQAGNNDGGTVFRSDYGRPGTVGVVEAEVKGSELAL
jgi:hypothetical protein